MATFPEMPYEELTRWTNSGQGGQLAIEERNHRLLSGHATWIALQRTVRELASVGRDGRQTGIVCHFTQVVARTVYLPKGGRSRVITGFAKQDPK